MSQTTFAEQVKEMLGQADAAYRTGDLAGARQIWEAVLQVDPENQPAHSGLQLTHLADDHWSRFDRSTSDDVALMAQLARVRDLLDTGLIDDAVRLVEQLAAKHIDRNEVLALRLEVMQAQQRQPQIRRAIEQARQQLLAGQVPLAIGAAREALELDPGNREAELLLEQAERAQGTAAPSEAQAEAAPELDLELDLSLTALTPPPAAPPARVHSPPPPPPLAGPTASATVRTMPQPVQSAATTASPETITAVVEDAPTVRDLLEAASDIESESHDVTGWMEADPFAAAEQAQRDQQNRAEASRLLDQARAALRSGDSDRALSLASRAQVLQEHLDGTQQVIDEARADAARKHAQLERIMQQGIDEFDRGESTRALASFSQVLQLSPGHPEAEDYLSRLSAASDAAAMERMVKATASDQALFENDLLALEAKGRGGAASNQTAPVASIPVATAGPVAHAATAPPPLPPPIAPQVSPAGAQDLHAIPALPTRSAPQLGARTAAQPAPLSASRPAQPKAGGLIGTVGGFVKGVTGRVVTRVVSMVLAVVVLAVIGLFSDGLTALFGSGSDDRSSTEQSRPSTRKTSTSAAASEAGAAAATSEPAAAGTPEPATAAASVTDVPGLVRDARAAQERGDLKRTVELLQTARTLAPSDFELADELGAAQRALRQQQEHEARLTEARDAWRLGDFEEAMRLLYRLPKEYQPPQYNRWLADGWHNLGVLAMQRGDVAEALQFFHDGLELNPGDKEMERHREVARRYRDRTVDSTFSTYAGGIALREMATGR